MEHMRTSSATPSDTCIKPRLSTSEVDRLELLFSINPKPGSRIKSSLAEELRVEVPRINNWFQNRRAKEKQQRKERGYQMTIPQETGMDEKNTVQFPGRSPPSSTSDRPFTRGFVSRHTVASEGGPDVKEETVACLINYFYSLMGQWYFSRPAQFWTRYHGGPTPKSHGQESPSPGKGTQTTNGDRLRPFGWAAESNSNPERRRFNRDEEDSEEERNHKKPKLKERDNARSAQRLACPYFKKDPTRYQQWRSCPGPGWGTVHRMREHLYRCHVLPPSCPRCHKTFEDEKSKLEHFVTPESCSVRDQPCVLEGLDPATHELLKSRKLLQGQDTEEAKWRAVYIVLFPGTEEKDIPSPYYEYAGTTTRDKHPYDTDSPELTRYEEFLKAELPPEVERKLTASIGAVLRAGGKISNTQIEVLKQEVVTMVRDAQLELFRLYCQTGEKATITRRNKDPEQTQESTTTTMAEDAGLAFRSQWHSLQSDGKTMAPVPEKGLDNDLVNDSEANWVFIPPDGYHSFTGFDGILFDLGAFETGIEATVSSSGSLDWEMAMNGASNLHVQ
ncbi:hypothetical protein QBC37DRAFT_422344 [Rhypophila decipiens]|uniref:Homeobox domain-containing protein n=1 Tax=Rhypophila decipiens TaxID=261697 RepID=A0AAN7B7P2_9PEZI|nr:hypothetical protein QBC37DRAFT_422344 [Rhypophila decipiens]